MAGLSCELTQVAYSAAGVSSPSAAGAASSAGASVGASSVAGASVGASVAGTSVAGASMLGVALSILCIYTRNNESLACAKHCVRV